MDEDELAELDQSGGKRLRALTYDRGPPQPSLASPHAFVCDDGRTYWIKRNAQDGLVAELVAGRVGALVGAAPMAMIVGVDNGALPEDGTANHLLGLGVGALDRPNMENFRHITDRAPDGKLDPGRLNAASVARVVTFQTWVGAGDTQILVDLRNGELFSIDHGELGAAKGAAVQPALIVAEGIPDSIGREPRLVEASMAAIEGITDHQLLAAVAQVPDGPGWAASSSRRLEIAQALAFRRDGLREAMKPWLQ